MGYYKLQRPAWNPRGQEIKYIVKDRVLTRGWPARYRDARSAAQQRQRSKMSQLSGCMPKLKPLFAIGYDKGVKPNGRAIGSYHMALGRALREWFSAGPEGWTLQPARLQLTDGGALLPKQLKIKRAGDSISVSWVRLDRDREKTLLFAARKMDGNEWITNIIVVKGNNSSVIIEIPTGWRGGRVETWCAFLVAGSKLKSMTHYEMFTAGGATQTSTVEAVAPLQSTAAEHRGELNGEGIHPSN